MIPTPVHVLLGKPGLWMIWFVIPDTDPTAYFLDFVWEDE